MQNRYSHAFRNHLTGFARMSYVHGSPVERLKSKGFSPDDIIDCSLGTNPYGCSPLVISALQDHDWTDVHRYPDPAYSEFIDALLSFWQPLVSLEPEVILPGAGTSGLLERILKATIEPGRAVLGYAPQFTEFVTEVFAQGGSYTSMPLSRQDHHVFDVERFLDYMSPHFSLVYIDNPNNPTGQVIPLASIEKILKKAYDLSLPVLIDEAYGDFTGKENCSLNIMSEFDNLITVRSFSKGSGLANLRIGYAVMQNPLMANVRKVDLPFPCSSAAAHAAAISLKDEDFVTECRQMIAESKRNFMRSCSRFYFAATDDEVPIIVMGINDNGTDLAEVLFDHAILTESGADFHNLGQNYVRLRIPQQTDDLIQRLNRLSLG